LIPSKQKNKNNQNPISNQANKYALFIFYHGILIIGLHPSCYFYIESNYRKWEIDDYFCDEAWHSDFQEAYGIMETNFRFLC